MSARHISKSAFFADDQQSAIATSWPDLVTAGERPRLIDEWQVRPEIWNMVRRAVDDASAPGQFILTGSSRPSDDVTRHSGAGRIARLRMRPFSTAERLHGIATVSLRSLLDGERPVSATSTASFFSIIHEIMVGGWPANYALDAQRAQQQVRDYLDESVRADLAFDHQQSIRRRDPHRLRALLRSIARSPGAPLSMATLAADVQQSGVEITRQTVQSYVDVLERVMLLELIPAWPTHLRSRARLRTSPKYYLADPSLNAAALGASQEHLKRDLALSGLLFESLVMRDLLVYAQRADADVYYYRDSNGLEIDAIIERRDGTWMAVEIKLGSSAVEQATRTLSTFANNVDTTRKGKPATLLVITGSGHRYVTKEGIVVIPFEHLTA